MYIGLTRTLKVKKRAALTSLVYFRLQAAVDQKALVRSRNRTPSTPHPGGYGGWRRA